MWMSCLLDIFVETTTCILREHFLVSSIAWGTATQVGLLESQGNYCSHAEATPECLVFSWLGNLTSIARLSSTALWSQWSYYHSLYSWPVTAFVAVMFWSGWTLGAALKPVFPVYVSQQHLHHVLAVKSTMVLEAEDDQLYLNSLLWAFNTIEQISFLYFMVQSCNYSWPLICFN